MAGAHDWFWTGREELVKQTKRRTKRKEKKKEEKKKKSLNKKEGKKVVRNRKRVYL